MTRRTTITLVGAGHAHLFVASRVESLIALGARVVLIEPAEFWYSGLASGMLGGGCTNLRTTGWIHER